MVTVFLLLLMFHGTADTSIYITETEIGQSTDFPWPVSGHITITFACSLPRVHLNAKAIPEKGLGWRRQLVKLPEPAEFELRSRPNPILNLPFYTRLQRRRRVNGHCAANGR